MYENLVKLGINTTAAATYEKRGKANAQFAADYFTGERTTGSRAGDYALGFLGLVATACDVYNRDEAVRAASQNLADLEKEARRAATPRRTYEDDLQEQTFEDLRFEVEDLERHCVRPSVRKEAAYRTSPIIRNAMEELTDMLRRFKQNRTLWAIHRAHNDGRFKFDESVEAIAITSTGRFIAADRISYGTVHGHMVVGMDGNQFVVSETRINRSIDKGEIALVVKF